MKTHDIQALITQLPLLALNNNPSQAEIESSFINLGLFDSGCVSLGKFSGETPWELHPDGDEFIFILDGKLIVTLLDTDNSQEIIVNQGNSCIIRRNVWHRNRADSPVTLLAVMASQHGGVSFAEDPRVKE